MKKRILSILTAGCLMAAMVPAAFAADATMSEDAFRSAVAQGGTVDLTGNVTLSSTLTIENGVIIDGNGYIVTYTPNTQSYAFDVQTDEAVKFRNITIDATAGSMTNGITTQNCVPDLTLEGTTLNVNRHGVALVPNGKGGVLNVTDGSVIQNKRVSDYETEAAYGDYRGISLWDVKDGTINISDSTIQGFGYTMNLAGTLVDGVRDFEGTKVNVTDSKLMGWTAFNVWSSSTEFNITNSYLKGINNSNGPSDGFSTIVVNDDIYGNGWGSTKENVFNIYGGTITSYRSGTASEELFRVDDKGITKVNFYKYNGRIPVEIIDGSGDAEAVFNSGYAMLPNDWIEYMTRSVKGDKNCTLTGYDGRELLFIPA